MSLQAVCKFPDHIRTWVHPLGSETTAEEKVGYEETLQFVERIVKVPLKTLTKEQMHAILLIIHFKLGADPEMKPGQYRSKPGDIVAIGKVTLDGNLHEHILRHDPPALPFFFEIQKHIAKGIDFEDMVLQKDLVSSGAKAFIEKYFLVVPSPKRVFQRMDQMLESVLKMLNEEENPILTACYAHQELGRIHPFIDWNGRVGRLFMNMILMQSGRQPIAFAIEKEYTEAVTDKDPGVFQKLVRNVSNMFEREAQIDPKDFTGKILL